MKRTPIIVLLATLAMAGCTSVQLINPAKAPAAKRNPGISIHDPMTVPRTERGGAKLATTPPAQSPATPTEPIAPLDPAEDIVAVGFASIGAQSGKDAAQQRLMAARASKIDAYRNLAEQVYGVTLGSETVLEDHKLQGDAVRTRIAGLVSGAELVSVEPLGADTYQTTLRLPARQLAQLRHRLQR